jgi:nitroimidazol reductase NimA-like FMN-containing flavoprotein (pyridoxamine 5'-phosphate oxidase superfamily)
MFKEMRRKDKLMTNLDTLALLSRGQEGVLGTIGDNGYPYTVIVNYVYYQGKLYFHCAKEGYKLDNIKKNPKVSFSVYDNVEVIGKELNTKYQSLVLFGKANVIDTTEEILMELIKKYSDLPDEIAKKMIAREINITTVVEIKIEHITGKVGI